MNLQQLEYIVAVDTYRHFATASEKCFVTQPTLSMMIRKLEEELDIQIFDRSRQPVVPTDAGIPVIAQARAVLREARRLKEIVAGQKGEIGGELRLGVIPTVAPYLLPLFLGSFLHRYPMVSLKIYELTTDQIIARLRKQELDAALLATPLNEASIVELPLFYEEFLVYASSGESILKKKYLLSKDIDVHRLWLLEEGHCLRAQVLNLCELRESVHRQLDYEAGSIDTLVKLVDLHKGITILPELAVGDLGAAQRKKVRRFRSPAPVREISIVTYRHFVKQRMLEALSEEILSSIPASMRKVGRKNLVIDLRG